MNLYEIDNAILDCVDVETGEIFDAVKFEELAMERDEKIENICLWIKNLNAEAEALKAEKDAFAQRQKAAESKAENLKKYIASYLCGTAFKTSKVAVSFRKSVSVELSDDINISSLPDEYLRFKEPEVNKTEIKKALSAGKVIAGAFLVEKQNIQIK